ncbi:MAG: hypothetical protein ACRCXB_32415 [Aeromonadaceae bacterium]
MQIIRKVGKFAPRAAAAAGLVALSGTASAAGLDFSAITGAVTGAEVLTGLAAVVGILALPKAGKWAFRQVLSMFGR